MPHSAPYDSQQKLLSKDSSLSVAEFNAIACTSGRTVSWSHHPQKVFRCSKSWQASGLCWCTPSGQIHCLDQTDTYSIILTWVFAGSVCTFIVYIGMVLLGLACQEGLRFSAETCSRDVQRLWLSAVDLSQSTATVGKPLLGLNRIRSFHVWPEFSPCTCHGVNAIRRTSANTARWWKAWQSVLTELQRNPCVSWA